MREELVEKSKEITLDTSVDTIINNVYEKHSDGFKFKKYVKAIYEELRNPRIGEEDTVQVIVDKFSDSKITVVEVSFLRGIGFPGIAFLNTYMQNNFGVQSFIPEPTLSLETTMNQLTYLYPIRSIGEPIRFAVKAVAKVSKSKEVSSLSIREFHDVYSRFVQQIVSEKLRIGNTRHEVLNDIFKKLNLPPVDISFSMEV